MKTSFVVIKIIQKRISKNKTNDALCYFPYKNYKEARKRVKELRKSGETRKIKIQKRSYEALK